LALSRQHLGAATRTLGQISLRHKGASNDQLPVHAWSNVLYVHSYSPVIISSRWIVGLAGNRSTPAFGVPVLGRRRGRCELVMKSVVKLGTAC
jgi:hypothetical protein